MAIPTIRNSSGQQFSGYTINAEGKYVPTNQGFASGADSSRVQAEMDVNNQRGGGKEKKAPAAPRAKSSMRSSLGGDTDPGVAARLDRLIDAQRGQTYFLERMFNILQRSPVINPKQGGSSSSKPSGHKDLEEEEKENIARNKSGGKGFMARMTGGFDSFMKSLLGWGKILEVLLLPLLIGMVSALSKAHSALAKIVAAAGVALAFGPTRRLITGTVGKALKWAGGKTLDALRGGTKEEFAARRAAAASEAEKGTATVAEATKVVEKPAGEFDKLGRKMPKRGPDGRFLKAGAKEEEGLFSLIGKVMPKIAPVFKILGKALIILNIVSTVVEGISGAVKGYKTGGAMGAIAGGARGIADGLVGWIFSLGTWAVGSLFKLFGADKLGEKIKAFDFNKLLDTVIDWVSRGISTVVSNLKSMFSGGFFAGIGKILLAPVDAMRGYLGAMLNSLPDVIKKHIPASVWAVVGRNGDGSAPDKNEGVAGTSAAENKAYAVGGSGAVQRQRESGKTYENNLSGDAAKQFQAGVASLRAGGKVDDGKMVSLLQSANPNASKSDLSNYYKNVVQQQAKTDKAIGVSYAGPGSASLVKTGAKVSGVNLDSLWAKVSPMIAQGESMGGNYDAKHGAKNNIQPGLTNQTIGQVSKSTGAVGKYQFLPQTTLIAAAKMAGLSLNDKFSPENQEKMGRALFDMRVKQGQAGGVNGILDSLSKEWASLPSPSKNGASWYAGDAAGNKSLGGMQRVAELTNAVNSSSTVGAQAGSITPPMSSSGPSFANARGGSSVVVAPTVNTKNTIHHGPITSSGPPAATVGATT